MKKLVMMSVTAMLVVMMAVSVNAQSIYYPLEVKIPFDFYVGNTLMHQGNYEVSTFGIVRGAVKMFGPQGAVVSITSPVEKKRAEKTGDELVFHRVNGEYFLQTIWTADNNVGYAIPKARREREQVASGATPQVIALAANHR